MSQNIHHLMNHHTYEDFFWVLEDIQLSVMGFLEKLRDKVKETFYFARFISPGKEKKHFRSTKIALAVSLLITFLFASL